MDVEPNDHKLIEDKLKGQRSPDNNVETIKSAAQFEVNEDVVDEPPVYRLYKRRFVGITAVALLNLAAGMCWPWFGPISNSMVDEFGVTLDQVNWLGNIEACIYVPGSLLTPILTQRYGLRRTCEIGAFALLLSAWIRYAGTPHSLSTNQAYGLLILGQFFSSVAQPIFQVIGPTYSESWFNLKGRTTATMIISVANPIGGALGQLISPLVGDTRQSILVLGIICTVAAPTVFLVGAKPPTPPTYAGSKTKKSLTDLLMALSGKERSPESHMSVRERLDFLIIFLLFGFLSGVTNAFAVLAGQILEPVGYSEDTAGLMGATLLLSGIVAAIITAPLSDRVFTHHLALTAKILIPPLAGAWLSLIWAVQPNNTQALFVIMAIIGVCSVTMLPVGLELGCEVTRNADASAALLWAMGNLCCVMFILVEGALRAGPDAHPPLNMHRSLIFSGTFIMVIASLSFFLHGKQVRKELDRLKLEQQQARQGEENSL
jgi:FLVCR family MFS transporter 7